MADIAHLALNSAASVSEATQERDQRVSFTSLSATEMPLSARPRRAPGLFERK